MQFNSNPVFRDVGEAKKLSFQEILKQAERVVSAQVTMRTGIFTTAIISLLSAVVARSLIHTP
jgi:NAD(P) transhydrogenase